MRTSSTFTAALRWVPASSCCLEEGSRLTQQISGSRAGGRSRNQRLPDSSLGHCNVRQICGAAIAPLCPPSQAGGQSGAQSDFANRAIPMRQFRQAIVWGCVGWVSSCPNFDFGVRSNALPFAFGMTPEAAGAALLSPLARASGRRDSEMYYTERTPLATGFIVPERPPLWLPFRHRPPTPLHFGCDPPIS